MKSKINNHIHYFNTYKKAKRFYNKQIKSCQLLESPYYETWFVDFSKQAIKDWKNLYVLLEEKL